MDEITFGRGIRALRIRRRLTQEQLADRVGVSRSVIARIEQGHASRGSIVTLERVAAALAARVVVRLSWNAEGLDRLLDARHAATVEEVVRRLRFAGWEIGTEVSFNEYGERGSIDVLGLHVATATLLVIEVKVVIGDAQELQSTLDRKVRLAPTIARRRGWRPRHVSVLLVLVDSRTNRARVGRLGETFGNAFPHRNRLVRAWLDSPDTARPLRGLWFLNTGPEPVVTQRVRMRSSVRTHSSTRPT